MRSEKPCRVLARNGTVRRLEAQRRLAISTIACAVSALALLTGCDSGTSPGASATGTTNTATTPGAPSVAGAPAGVTQYTYEIVHTWPHDRDAFTQGLVYLNGELLESTGLYGHSSLRKVELETGKVLKQVDV